MKIKIFSGNNCRCIEKCVNKFIKNKCVCKIIQTQSCCEGCISITITIMYDDGYNCEYLKSAFQRFGGD